MPQGLGGGALVGASRIFSRREGKTNRPKGGRIFKGFIRIANNYDYGKFL